MGRLKFSLAIVLFILGFVVSISAQTATDPPTIKSVLPKKVTVSTEDLRVRVTGKKLDKNSQVLVYNEPLPTDKVRFQRKSLLATIPASLLGQPGTLSLSVK